MVTNDEHLLQEGNDKETTIRKYHMAKDKVTLHHMVIV